MSGGVKCLIDGCDNAAHCRGLCVACYHVAYRDVIARKTTWAKLQKAGLARPDARTQKGDQTPFRKAMHAKERG